jgi:drug/metabolite transporter (DMT)-like permease
MTMVGSSVGASRNLVHAPLFLAQGLRYGVAAVLFLLATKWVKAPLSWPRGREWLWLTGVSATGLVLFNVALVRGLAHASPAAMAVAVACAPVALGTVGPLMAGRRPGTRALWAAVVVTAGSVLVEGLGRASGLGVAWAAVLLACEVAFTLLAVPVLAKHGPWGVSLHAAWIAAAMLMILSIASEGASAWAQLTPAAWATVGYLSVMTVMAFVLWYSTVASAGAALAGLLTGIAPVSAACVGAALGAGVPSAGVWAGALVVLGGLALGFLPTKASPGVLPSFK